MAEKFDITGFVGATTYMRDGVTPADYGWNSCMPDMAQPVWGLFTYGYGFQPDIGRLVIAPFLHPAMNGTTAKYRWCRADIAVQYHTPYAFTVTASALPQPVVIRFLNQTPGETYAAQTVAERLERTADADGNVDVPMTHLQGTFTLCDPDEEIRPDEGNLALDRPANIINGYEDQTFRPNEPLSRQDFFKITYNLMTRALFWKDESVEPSDLSQFTDAASVSDYAIKPTQYMVALGVVRGTGTALEPKGTTERQAAIAMFRRAYYIVSEWLRKNDDMPVDPDPDDDGGYSGIPAWAVVEFSEVVKLGIIPSSLDNADLSKPISRAQMC